MSKAEIERMVQEAEKFADEDRKVQERSTAKGKLETFAYGLKHSVEDQKVQRQRGSHTEAEREPHRRAATPLTEQRPIH